MNIKNMAKQWPIHSETIEGVEVHFFRNEEKFGWYCVDEQGKELGSYIKFLTDDKTIVFKTALMLRKQAEVSIK